MTNVFIEPENLDDERLLYWTKYFVDGLTNAEWAVNRMKTHLNAYVAECERRGLWHCD